VLGLLGAGLVTSSACVMLLVFEDVKAWIGVGIGCSATCRHAVESAARACLVRVAAPAAACH
jgi:hypothetical protein